MQDFTKFGAASSTAVGFDAGLRLYMVRIYKYMCLALILTGGIAFAAANSPAFLGMMYNEVNGTLQLTMFAYIVMLAPLAPWLVYFFNGGRLSYQATHLVFWSFAALFGLSLFSIFAVYTGESIVRVFFITSALFGGMALYGYTTKRDLTAIGSFLIMGMWGLFIAMIINMFLQSSAMHYAISIIGVFIFTGLTAYENQALKRIYYQVAGNSEEEGKTAVVGAMTLYITFINLFMMLIRLIGEKR